MNNDLIRNMQSTFDSLARTVPEENVEFWFARDLMTPLDYVRWENFLTAIQRAITSCETMGYISSDHFRGVTKMIAIGKGGQREVDDFMLTRYACYLYTDEHVQNNRSVRGMLGQRGIKPETLPPEEDIQKLERRVKSQEKKLGGTSGRLPPGKA